MERVRKEADVRLNISRGKKGVELTIPEADFTYGMPGKPSTPIKEVICNYYGDNAAYETMKRYEMISKIVIFITVIHSHQRSCLCREQQEQAEKQQMP